MRFRYLAALVAVAVLAALPLAAQEQRGSIEGVVKDAQGGAIVGATVVARSLSGISREAVTDATGTYRFAALSPGRYDVTATLSGFAPAKVQNIDLRLGELKNINIALTPGGLTETVQVVAESPLIAITQSARSTSLREEQIEKMPKGRDFTSLVTQAPGANQETAKLNGISIDGASSGENRFIIDGAETTNLQNGLSVQVLVTDFVDEVQVKSSGYTAEYGGATGGVISAVTKSGTNSFHGAANLYFQSDALDSDFRPTLRLVPTNSNAAEYVTYPEDEYQRWEPGFQLSGPIVKDKVWFFAGYQPVFRPLDRTRPLNDGVERTFSQDFNTNYGTANITAQPNAQWRFRANYNLSNRKQEGRLQALDGTSNPAANYAINDVTPNWATSASIDYTPSNKVYVEPPRRLLLPRLLQRGRLRRHPLPVLRVERRPGRRPAPVPAAGRPTATCPPTTRAQFDKQKRMNVQFDTTFFFAGGGPAPAQGRPAVRPDRQRGPLGRDRQPGPPAVEPGALRPARRLRLLPGAQQRRGPRPGLRHPGRRQRQQPGPLHPGLLDDRQPPDPEPRPAHGERDRSVVLDRGRDPVRGHRVRLRREVRAARRLRVGRHGRRQDEGLRPAGASSTTSSSSSCPAARSAATSGWSTTTRSTPPRGTRSTSRAARRPARARCCAARSTSATPRTTPRRTPSTPT